MTSPLTTLITSPMQRIPVQTPRAILRGEHRWGLWRHAVTGSMVALIGGIAAQTLVIQFMLGGPALITLGLVVGFAVAVVLAVVWGLGLRRQIRRRILMQSGVLVRGEVIESGSRRARIRYTLSDGRVFEMVQAVSDVRRVGGLAVGDAVGVLVDRGNPRRAVAPSLTRVVFVPVVDRRPADVIAVAPARQLPEAPIEAALKASFGGPVAGSLRLEDTTLVWVFEGQRVAVPLDGPFRMDVSAWLMTPESVALNVSLRSSLAPPTVEAVGFSVALPQSSVSLLMPLREARLPFVDAAAFERLWPAILMLARTRGEHVQPWVSMARPTKHGRPSGPR